FPSAIYGSVHIILAVLLMYMILYFMLLHYNYFENILIKYVPFPEKNAQSFSVSLKNITNATVYGHGIIALVQGTLVTIGFLIFGIQNALLWGVVGLLLGFIPMAGPGIIYVPAGIFLLTSGDTFAGIGILVYGVVGVGLLEYFLRF